MVTVADELATPYDAAGICHASGHDLVHGSGSKDCPRTSDMSRTGEPLGGLLFARVMTRQGKRTLRVALA